MRRRILIITLSFGSGHVTAARAVASAMGRISPESDIRTIDALDKCRLLFRVFYVWPYWAMIRFAPGLWKWFFGRRVSQRKSGTAPVLAWKWGCSSLFSEIASFDPDLIVCCEVGACEIGVIARRNDMTRAAILNVITDFEAEPIWVQPEVAGYAVANDSVRRQLCDWGVPSGSIHVVGIPLSDRFQADLNVEQTQTNLRFDERPIVLLMGGGMGPTNMDRVAKELLDTGLDMHIVALPGKDKRARRRLLNLKGSGQPTISVLDWTDDIASLMRAATVLVTKPGGVTIAEASACKLPMIFFDAIPGPEETNARLFVDARVAIDTRAPAETASVVASLLRDKTKLREMGLEAAALARPDATEQIAKLAFETKASDGPVMFVAISNGAGHIRVANGIAEAIKAREPGRAVRVIDVADYMSPIARFTHVTAYLWIVKHTPAIWGWIDRFQKRQEHTSPDWFYRRNCAKLFNLARSARPSAIVATEVGCCEIAALIKRDLGLDVPLVAVNINPDMDKAWVKPEVDLYCFATDESVDELVMHGARRDRVVNWGPAISGGFADRGDRLADRSAICLNLALDSRLPIVVIAGGGEGIGRIEEITSRLLQTRIDPPPQFVVLTGNNDRLRERCGRLANEENVDRLRILGWIDEDQMPQLMRAADLLVSKLGNMFYEAIASELPLIALEPMPGSEQIQYRQLADWKVGRAVHSIDEMAETVELLLGSPEELAEIKKCARLRRGNDAAGQIANWLKEARPDAGSPASNDGAYRRSRDSARMVV